MLLKIIENLFREAEDYRLNDALCTRIISPKSTCGYCMESCPLSCIKVTGQIMIDHNCINCGICSSKCPTGAIAMKISVLEYLHYEINRGADISLGCMKKRTNGLYFKNFCLGNFSDEYILYLLLKKPSLLRNFDTSKCGQCELSTNFSDYKNRKDRIERNLKKLNLHGTFSEAPSSVPSVEDCDYDKREFLKSFLKIGEFLNDIPSEKYIKKFHFHQLYKELLNFDQRLYHMVEIYFPKKNGKCSQCMACIKLCPSKALRLEKTSIYLDISQCSGCGLCEKVCYDHALVMGKLSFEDFNRTSIKIIEGDGKC